MKEKGLSDVLGDNMQSINSSSITTFCVIVGTIILLVVFIIIVLYREGKQKLIAKRTEIVKEYSKKYQKIKQINGQYPFSPLQQQYRIAKNCKTKQEFDKTDIDTILCSDISDNLAEYKQLLNSVIRNQNQYELYNKDFNICLYEITDEDKELYLKWDFFDEYEEKLCEELRQKPITELIVKVEKEYYSPKGRNHYRACSVFDTKEIIAHYKEARLHSELDYIFKTSYYKNDNRRDPIPPSMRYDIMKRDGFRCVLCGASAQDGVKLHIDHILPVSKGGVTEPSNLRTLCDKCNLGKGAKYDPYGFN